MKLKEYFSSKEKWTQGVFFRDSEGKPRLDDAGASCCLSAALQLCYPFPRSVIREKIRNKIGMGIIRWNDSPDRKFEDVKALVEELDI